MPSTGEIFDRVVAGETLIEATPDAPASAVIVGYNWTMVEWADGVGLVTTPEKGVDGARTTPESGRYTRRSLRDLARLALSGNPYERAIGCAAVNAGINRHDLKGPSGNGLEPLVTVNGTTVVVGRFPSLDERLPGALVLERNPGPGDLPASAAAEVIPGCARLIITATTWVNESLAGLLRLVDGAHVSLVGPGTPLSPVLHGHGIHRLSGFVVTERIAMRQAISEGASARQFRHLGRDVNFEI